MNILLINHYAGSTEMGMEFRPYYMAQEWIKLGYKVDIIAGDYSHLRKINPIVTNDFQTEDIDGITYHWVKTGDYEGNGVKRAGTMFRFVGKLWLYASRIVKELQPDVVIASSTYPIDTYAAQKIAKMAKARLIHEVHDMWPATLIEVGGMSKYNPFVVTMQFGENSAYKHSNYVVSLLPCAKEYMIKHGMDEEKFKYITNGIVLNDWMNPTCLPNEHKSILEKYKADGKFIVGYFGGHALSNALDILVDVAEYLKNDNKIQIVLVGNGVEKQRLEERAKEKKLDNICFMPPIEKMSIPNLITYFDCVYIGATESPLYRFGVAANKIYDSMMGGKPLLYAINAPNNYVNEYQCGISIKAGDVKSLANGIKTLENMDEKDRKKMGENGRKAVIKYYNYSVLAEKFSKLFNK